MSNSPYKRFALVIPGWNLEECTIKVLERYAKALETLEANSFKLYLFDDGSTDKTHEKMLEAVEKFKLPALVTRNKENLGLVATLKKAYDVVLADEEWRATHIFKLDLDEEQDPQEVLPTFVERTQTGAALLVGVLQYTVTHEQNSYEHARQTEMREILKKAGVVEGLSPEACGSLLFTREALELLVSHPAVSEYDRRWGLDFRMPLICKALDLPVEVLPLYKVNYTPARRGLEKVSGQYDSYLETIEEILKWPARNSSKYYGVKPTLTQLV